MRNDIIVDKLIAYANKIIDYCEGYDYEAFLPTPNLWKRVFLI